MFNRRGMFRPILPGLGEKDLGAVPVDTLESDVSPRTLTWHRELGRRRGQMLTRVNRREGLFQTIHSVLQTSRCDIFVHI